MKRRSLSISEAESYATPAGRRQTNGEFEHALRAGKLVWSPGMNIRKSDPNFLAKLERGAKPKRS
jgi:hypothetical protein